MGRARAMGIGAAVTGLVMLGVYLSIVAGEDDSLGRAVPWAAAIGAASGAALGAGLLAPGRAAVGLFAAGGFVFLAIGVLAIFSIGFPLVIAGTLCLAALPAASEGD